MGLYKPTNITGWPLVLRDTLDRPNSMAARIHGNFNKHNMGWIWTWKITHTYTCDLHWFTIIYWILFWTSTTQSLHHHLNTDWYRRYRREKQPSLLPVEGTLHIGANYLACLFEMLFSLSPKIKTTKFCSTALSGVSPLQYMFSMNRVKPTCLLWTPWPLSQTIQTFMWQPHLFLRHSSISVPLTMNHCWLKRYNPHFGFL